MNKKKQKVKINKNLVLALSGALVLSVGICLGMIGISAVKADVPFWDKVAQVTGIELANRIDTPDEDTFGAFPGPDVYNRMYFHEGFEGNATFQFDLSFQQPTSTSDVAAQATQLLLGTQRVEYNMLCNMATASITPTTLFGYDFRLGVTTTATSGAATLIADTAVVTSTGNILNKEDDEGTQTDEVWPIYAGQYLSAMMTFDEANATSSASFTAAGGNTGNGVVSVNCWNME